MDDDANANLELQDCVAQGSHGQAQAASATTVVPLHVEAGLRVHERGVSLAFLKRFAAEKQVGGRMTTASVCADIVKPVTEGSACAYFTLLANNASDVQLVGRSHYFISHSWSYHFNELVRALENFEEQLGPQSTPRYYWYIFPPF